MAGRSATLTLTALDDADMSSETLTFTLSTPVNNAGYTLDPSAARRSVAVLIDPMQPAVPKVQAAAPELSVSLSAVAPVTDPAVIFEAESTRIVITAGAALTTKLDVPVSISGVDDSDYRLFQGTEQILPGSGTVHLLAATASATLRLVAVDDADSAAEDLQFNLDAPADSSYTLGATASATISIHPIATYGITSSTVLEVAERTGRVEMTVELTASPSVDVTIPVHTMDISATDADYRLMTTELQFPADGSTLTGTIVLDLVADDSAGEPPELFRVVLGEPTPASRGLIKGTHGSVSITITDSGVVPMVASFDILVAAQTRVAELDGEWPITLQLSRPRNGFEQIPVTLGGTATQGSDYEIVETDTILTQGSTIYINFDAGVTLKTMIIRVLEDTDDEETEETIALSFGTLPSGVIADTENNAREITIVPAPPPVTLSLFVNPTTITAPSVDNPTPETRILSRRPTVGPSGLVTVDIRADAAPTVDVSVLFSVAGSSRAYDLKAADSQLGIIRSDRTSTLYSVRLPAGRTSTSLNLTLDADQHKAAGRIVITLEQPALQPRIKRNLYKLSDNPALQTQEIRIIGANDKETRPLSPIR